MDGAPSRFLTSLSAMGGVDSFGLQQAAAIRRNARMCGLWSSTVSLCRSVQTCALNRRRDITGVWTNYHCISQLHLLLPRTPRFEATNAPHADAALCFISMVSDPSLMSHVPKCLYLGTTQTLSIGPAGSPTGSDGGAHTARVPSAWRSLSSLALVAPVPRSEIKISLLSDASSA